MDWGETKKDLRNNLVQRNKQQTEEIINLLKKNDPDLTFEKAKNILMDTIEVLHVVSMRRKI
jgi:hypothetical protein